MKLEKTEHEHSTTIWIWQLQEVNKPDGKPCSRAHCADVILYNSGSTDIKLAICNRNHVVIINIEMYWKHLLYFKYLLEYLFYCLSVVYNIFSGVIFNLVQCLPQLLCLMNFMNYCIYNCHLEFYIYYCNIY